MRLKTILFLALGLSFFFAPIARADWTPAKRLTWTSGWSFSPAIAADSSGHLHVVWSDGTPGNHEVYYVKSTDAGATWSTRQRLTWTSGGSYDPVVAADSSGLLHLVWYDNTPGKTEVYYKKSTDAGVTWTTSRRLTWNSVESNHPALFVDSSGHLHVVWYDNPPDDIYYKKSSDGGSTWSAGKRLTWTVAASYGPAVTADSSGNIYTVWYEGVSGGGSAIFLKKSPDGGATWPPSRRLTWTPGYSSGPRIAVDASDYLHLIWRDDTPGNDEIYYRKGSDEGINWTTSRRLTWTQGGSSDAVIAADSTGHLHVVWSDNTPGSDEIYYTTSTDAGVTWSTGQRLTWNSGFSQYPAVSVDSSGNLHLVWSDTTPGSAEIYYRKFIK